MGRISHERFDDDRPRDRLRKYLARLGFLGRPSDLAREVGLSGKVAENLLLGHWPSDTTFRALLRRFGRDLRDALCDPDIDPTIARFRAEERQLEERLNAIRARRIQAQGGGLGDPECLAEVADEKCALTGDLFAGGMTKN